MALYLKVRDNRWQFSFGSKYMVIADVVADSGTTAVAGGTPIQLAKDPQVKASRAPWFSVFASATGIQASYVPSDFGTTPTSPPPGTTLANVNSGKLIVYDPAGAEYVGDLSTILSPQGALQGMFVFQGME